MIRAKDLSRQHVFCWRQDDGNKEKAQLEPRGTGLNRTRYRAKQKITEDNSTVHDDMPGSPACHHQD